MAENEDNSRRRMDDMFALGLNKCELGINQCNQQLGELREGMHAGMAALNLQIAKMPVPLTLDQMEQRFVTRKETEQAALVIGKLIESFVTGDEMRPLKVAIYGLWSAIGLSMLGAAVAWVLK